MNKESFLLGVSLTCLIVMLVGPSILGYDPIVYTKTNTITDTLKVEVVKPKPNFQLEAHQIKSSLNKSKLKHLLIYTHALQNQVGIIRQYQQVMRVVLCKSNHKQPLLSSRLLQEICLTHMSM